MAMRYVRLGPSGLKVSQICLGTWHMPRSSRTDEYGARTVDVEEFSRVVKVAVDRGLNFFDTANRYHGAMTPVDAVHRGNAERVLGEVLKGYERESVVVATKVGSEMAPWANGGGLSRKHVMWQISESLRRLQMDYVDVYLMHTPDRDTPRLETLRAMSDLVSSGRVHYIGCSNHDPEEVADFMHLASEHGLHGIVTLQEEYNLLSRRTETRMVPTARHYGLSVMAYSPLAEGMLTEKYLSGAIPQESRATYSEGLRKNITKERLGVVRELSTFAKQKGVSLPQLALAWIVSKQERLGVTLIPIIGVSSSDQLTSNLDALDVRLTSEEVNALDRTASKLNELGHMNG